MFAELIRAGLQALIEAEATEAIGTGRYQRSGERTVHRNGHRPKTVSTTAGDIEVAIPKLRAGSFFPSLLERRRRIDRSGSSSDGSCSRACPRSRRARPCVIFVAARRSATVSWPLS